MENRIANCKQGRLRGIPGRNQEITVFRGVPYAQPPIGELRWRAPQPPQNWYGIREADRFGAMPVQVKGSFLDGGKFSEIYSSEDCLYLNIWTPAHSADEKLPVLVWFHGGGFQGGYAHDPMFDGEYLSGKGIIVVTVSYRLGLMGFFCHPDMRKESPYGVPGNFGTLDQVAALKWINQNISAFGGDPEKVTIDGQSAGGGSVCNMMCTPLAKGLFRGAIVQSGDMLGVFPDKPLTQSEEDGVKVAKHFGASSLDDLRKLPVSELVREDYDAVIAIAGSMCTPVVDGVIIPKKQGDMLINGEGNSRVPMIFGSNSDEGFGARTLSQYKEQLNKYGEWADKIFELYPAASDEEASSVSVKLSGEQWFARLKHWALVREKMGLPTWHYRFCRGTIVGGKNLGAVHSGELGFVFGNRDILEELLKAVIPHGIQKNGDSYDGSTDEKIDAQLTELMSDYWVNFVKNGDPNGSGLPEWNRKTLGSQHMQFDEESGMKDDLFNNRIEVLFNAEKNRYGILI